MTSDHETSRAAHAEGLRFAYGDGDFSLEVAKLTVATGEHTAFIGPSGCGKTTLLRILTGALPPDRGHVVSLGVDLTAASEAKRRSHRLRRIGMVFQSFALIESLSAMENILLPARLATGGRDAVARARDLASALGVEHTLRRRPGRLSQGERQRIAIARALVTRPGVVVCDEPTGNLDPSRASDAVGLILREADEIGATVLFVTHDRSLLDRFDRVIDMTALHAPSTRGASA